MRMRFIESVWPTVFLVIDLKKTTLRIKDGTTPTPKSLDITIGEGNLSFTERRTVEYTLDRGLLDEVREGDQVPVEVSLDFIWDYISGQGATSANSDITGPVEVLKGIGQASANGWVSTDSDGCRPYAVDIEVDHEPTPTTCGDTEILTLSDFRWEQLDYDLRAGTIAVSGRCNIVNGTLARYSQT